MIFGKKVRNNYLQNFVVTVNIELNNVSDFTLKLEFIDTFPSNF
jgi:hypothetical protein